MRVDGFRGICRIHSHSVEQLEIEQRTIELACKHRFEVSDLLRVVGKLHSQPVLNGSTTSTIRT